jgi:protein kinase C substrate 80K-H
MPSGTRTQGGKIRSSYIAFAQKEKKRLEALLVVQAADVAAKEEEVARLRGGSCPPATPAWLTGLQISRTTPSPSPPPRWSTRRPRVRARSLRRPSLTDTTPALYASLQAHALALKSLRAAHARSLEREEQLGAILDALRTSYNPNYQDMGVLEAVRGWEALAGLPHINDVRKGDAAAVKAEEDAEVVPDAEGASESGDGLWGVEELEQRMDETLAADYDGLLIEHDKHVGAPLADSLRACRHTRSST